MEFYGQFSSAANQLTEKGYDYVNTVQKAITAAESAIDNYLQAPSGFFTGGGVEVANEYHNGTEIGKASTHIRFFGVRKSPFLRLNYTPILSVTALEEETSAGSWTSRTEGRGSDYLVTEKGVYYLRNSPAYDVKNVRATYNAGYAQTPQPISECAARLAAALIHQVVDSAARKTVQTEKVTASFPEMRLLTQTVFSESLKDLVKRYRRHVPPKIV